MTNYRWARYGGYEVSSRGDKRFSAFYATMPDGRTIEEHYQCDVKGYEPGGRNWRLGKGKPPLVARPMFPEYLCLWMIWAQHHPKLIDELARTCIKPPYNGWLSDRFATTPVNQAHALSVILNARTFTPCTPSSTAST